MLTPRSHRALPVAAVAFLLAACGSGQDPTTAPAHEVDIVDNAFEPASLEVAVGETVVWTNTGQVAHTVTFDDGPDSGTMPSEETYSRTFEEAGEFPYVCTIHPGMEGTVTVTE